VPANTPAGTSGAPVVAVPAGPPGPGAGTGTGTGTAPGVTGWGAPGGAAPGGPSGPAAPAPRAAPPAAVVVPAIPPLPGPYRIQRQRSLADMANEQLRRDKKDPLTQGVEGAAVDDCLHAPNKPSAMGGLLALPGLAARALTDKCAK